MYTLVHPNVSFIISMNLNDTIICSLYNEHTVTLSLMNGSGKYLRKYWYKTAIFYKENIKKLIFYTTNSQNLKISWFFIIPSNYRIRLQLYENVYIIYTFCNVPDRQMAVASPKFAHAQNFAARRVQF